MCHLVLLMPILGVGVFFIVPVPIALPIYLGITAVSLFIYVKLLNAMHVTVTTGREAMVGAIAEVESAAATDGRSRIRYRNERWLAVSPDRLDVGDQVEIIGFEGVRIIVRRVEGDR
ncbi:MAG: NfeD family protein [Candidatus Bipolaricaulia bacterium]